MRNGAFRIRSAVFDFLLHRLKSGLILVDTAYTCQFYLTPRFEFKVI